MTKKSQEGHNSVALPMAEMLGANSLISYSFYYLSTKSDCYVIEFNCFIKPIQSISYGMVRTHELQKSWLFGVLLTNNIVVSVRRFFTEEKTLHAISIKKKLTKPSLA